VVGGYVGKPPGIDGCDGIYGRSVDAVSVVPDAHAILTEQTQYCLLYPKVTISHPHMKHSLLCGMEQLNDSAYKNRCAHQTSALEKSATNMHAGQEML
jgi:hypothetical protein